MRKLSLLKEALLATILLLITVFLVNFFPLKFELVKPIKQDFGDFDIYDLHYSGHQDNNTDPNIVLVQVGDSLKEISKQLKLLSAYKPAIIGIDVDFKTPSDDPGSDSALQKQIHDMPEVVTGHRLVIDSQTHHLKVLRNYFDDDTVIKSRSGYFNFIGEEVSVVRQYAPFIKLDTNIEYALTSRILEKFDPKRFTELKRRNNKIEAINYSGNTEHYTIITRDALMADSTNLLEAMIKGKIILLGILYTNPPLLMDDIHYTPMNSKVTGKSLPDMYGVVIHANILSMLLSSNYIKLKSEKFTYLLASLIVFLLTLYQLRLHKRKVHTAHWKLILIQLGSIVLIVYIFFLLFSYFHVKVDLLPLIIAIVLSVEVFGPFRRAAEWLNGKMTYKPRSKKKYRHTK